MTFSIYFFILLVIVLSMDAFTAGLSYGMGKVHVPFFSLLTIALLSGSMLTASMLAGNFILQLIPVGLTKGISFFVLFLLSLYKLYDALPQLHIKNNGLTTGTISEKVNKTDKAVLSGKEAAILAFALSVDNISAGLCTGSIPLPVFILLLLTTVIHFASIKSGILIGNLLADKSSYRFAWMGSIILMILAFCRLF